MTPLARLFAWLKRHLWPIRVAKVSVESCGPFLLLELDDMYMLLQYIEAGDRPTAEMAWMTRAQIDVLPDFDGF